MVCYVRETLDAFQQISEKFSKVREPVSWTTEELSLLKKGNELEYDEEAVYTQFYDMKVTKKSW